MSYSGSCHCGTVAFTVDADLPNEATSCNCSHCRRKGFLLTFVPIEALDVESGEENLIAYTFNKHEIEHLFCEECGCQPFGVGIGPNGEELAAINLRCVPEADLDLLTVLKIDGASL